MNFVIHFSKRSFVLFLVEIILLNICLLSIYTPSYATVLKFEFNQTGTVLGEYPDEWGLKKSDTCDFSGWFLIDTERIDYEMLNFGQLWTGSDSYLKQFRFEGSMIIAGQVAINNFVLNSIDNDSISFSGDLVDWHSDTQNGQFDVGMGTVALYAPSGDDGFGFNSWDGRIVPYALVSEKDWVSANDPIADLFLNSQLLAYINSPFGSIGGSYMANPSVVVQPVPEPSTITLVIIGLIGIGKRKLNRLSFLSINK